jgi:hypothetical protein
MVCVLAEQTPKIGLAELAVQSALLWTTVIVGIPGLLLGGAGIVVLSTLLMPASSLLAGSVAVAAFWTLSTVLEYPGRRVFLSVMSNLILTMPDPSASRSA